MKNQTITFWLARCGETTWAVEGRIRGVTDLPLSSSGQSMALEDAQLFASEKITVVHHPPDEAATDTAGIIANLIKAKVKSSANLADPDLGLLEGITEQAFAERYAKRYKPWREDPLSLVPPDGEDFLLARDRLFLDISRLLKKAKGAQVVFVLHDIALGMLRCWLTDTDCSELWKLVEDRPRVERYALSSRMLEQLQQVAEAQTSEA